MSWYAEKIRLPPKVSSRMTPMKYWKNPAPMKLKVLKLAKAVPYMSDVKSSLEIVMYMFTNPKANPRRKKAEYMIGGANAFPKEAIIVQNARLRKRPMSMTGLRFIRILSDR
jgi:hypothetical protein